MNMIFIMKKMKIILTIITDVFDSQAGKEGRRNIYDNRERYGNTLEISVCINTQVFS